MNKTITPLNIGNIVAAEIKDVPCAAFFFAQNCDPRKIFCHVRQGGTLSVSRQGNIAISFEETEVKPMPGQGIVLFRKSSIKSHPDFTRAIAWAPVESWKRVAWALEAKTMFRVTAYDHRTSGHFRGNSQKEVVAVEATLATIVDQYPRGGENDVLGDCHSTKLGKLTLSCKNRWEKLVADGKWDECGDPRPLLSK